MRTMLRLAVTTAAMAALMGLSPAAVQAGDPPTPPVHLTPHLANCEVGNPALGHSATVTVLPGVNGHPTTNTFTFAATSSIQCDGTATHPDSHTITGTYSVLADGTTTGVQQTLETGMTGETCEQGHSAHPGDLHATQEGPTTIVGGGGTHVGSTLTGTVEFVRTATNVVAWGHLVSDSPTLPDVTYTAELHFSPTDPADVLNCANTDPAGPKISSAHLVGTATLFTTS